MTQREELIKLEKELKILTKRHSLDKPWVMRQVNILKRRMLNIRATLNIKEPLSPW